MTTATTRPLDLDNALRLLAPLRWEMGTRNFRHSEAAAELTFQVGTGPSTTWVSLTVNASDLFDVEFFKARAGKRTTLGRLDDVFGAELAVAMLGEWCAICSRRGW